MLLQRAAGRCTTCGRPARRWWPGEQREQRAALHHPLLLHHPLWRPAPRAAARLTVCGGSELKGRHPLLPILGVAGHGAMLSAVGPCRGLAPAVQQNPAHLLPVPLLPKDCHCLERARARPRPARARAPLLLAMLAMLQQITAVRPLAPWCFWIEASFTALCKNTGPCNRSRRANRKQISQTV